MYEFLTLAITETDPIQDEFSVIAMEVKAKQLTKFDLRKMDIVSNQGEIFWDIGFTTFAKEIVYPSFGNNYKQTVAGVSLGENRLSELKNILEAKSTDPKSFFDNEKVQFTIVKVSKIEDMTKYLNTKKCSEGILQFYLKVYIKGLPDYQNSISILNKDYRWKKYWNHICNKNIYEEKKSQYLSLLNRKNKSIYLILYRQQFKENTWFWISGIHWL